MAVALQRAADEKMRAHGRGPWGGRWDEADFFTNGVTHDMHAVGIGGSICFARPIKRLFADWHDHGAMY